MHHRALFDYPVLPEEGRIWWQHLDAPWTMAAHYLGHVMAAWKHYEPMPGVN